MSAPTSIVFGRQSKTVPGTPERICMLGDSKTAGVGFGPWYSIFAPTVEAAQIAAGLGGVIPSGSLKTPITGPTATHVWLNSGVAGDDCTCYLLDTIASRVGAFRPDKIIIYSDINCAQHKVGGPSRSGINTSDAVCTANHLAVAQQCAAIAPTVWVSSYTWGEQWPDGANANDSILDAKIAITESACASAGVMHVNLREAFFAWSQINNPGKANQGFLTSDGIHENAAGIAWDSDNLFPLVQFSL